MRRISRGEKNWIPLMDEFWKPFITLIEKNDAEVSREDVNKPIILGKDQGNVVECKIRKIWAFCTNWRKR